MATAFVTAAAAMLMIPVSFLIDRRRTQGAGLFLLAAVIIRTLKSLAESEGSMVPA